MNNVETGATMITIVLALMCVFCLLFAGLIILLSWEADRLEQEIEELEEELEGYPPEDEEPTPPQPEKEPKHVQ